MTRGTRSPMSDPTPSVRRVRFDRPPPAPPPSPPAPPSRSSTGRRVVIRPMAGEERRRHQARQLTDWRGVLALVASGAAPQGDGTWRLAPFVGQPLPTVEPCACGHVAHTAGALIACGPTRPTRPASDDSYDTWATSGRRVGL